MPESNAMKKSPKRRKTSSNDKADKDVITDPRFANIQSDPRYRLPSKKHTRVKIDKRFAHMFHDKDFSRNAAVDRYGRKLRRDDTKKQLEKFYRLDKDDVEGQISADDDEEVQKELLRVEKEDYDPARDGGFSESSSSEESSSDEESEAELQDKAAESGQLDSQTGDIPLGEITDRIAVVNLDWDNIRAEDLMAVFSSFLPTGGKILNVAVYPSEFGKERMEREEMEGPPKEVFAKRDAEVDSDVEAGDDEEEEEKIKQAILKEDEGQDFDSTQLRKYQLERLRYFYAVLTCSSKDAAKHIYDTVDGTEYMSSANFFDLRFVPESTDFAEDVPRDECNRIPDGYKPNEFVTDALQHSKVKLTWDTDDKARKDAQARAFKGGKKEIDENDLKAYLGSDSSDSEEEHAEVVDSTEAAGATTKLSKKEAERARIRALLGLSNDAPSKAKEKGPVGDMEVTFAAGLTAAPARDSVFENEPEKEETTREKYIRKERERKQRRKAKLKAAKSGTVPEIDADKPTAESKEEEDLGFDDPFFTAPELDSAKVAAKRKEEKRKQRQQREADEAASAAQRAELELLMMDDKTSTIKHFDMNEIEKAQKRAKKAGKHRKGKKDEATMPVDDFKVDVKDPRFQRIYESHEYAIDPTNPRFRQTDGMKALLEEGRKRRRHLAHDEPDGDAVEPIKKKKRGKTAGPDRMPETEDLSKLVEQVKAKAKMV
ncbi:pre-rRNA-processing protein esf1 [Coccidioides posadasii str. Silveira]|uniref:Pre-rRNA-processing protein ESF1 n=1 Tax=Coccidioides posadasii RMSCC 3488 TaxID=454284 RepID=A0A0J6F6J3_COCPO|nr:pre-rRNA-processing protein ESF1 [Coccidioides posadasii RMSCC 3488]QVM07680.1 pre-rRNA-processing protein esf1 [Coccidioides posadasii str. Silveira]